VSAFHLGGVIEAAMNACTLAGKDWAAFLRVVGYGQAVIELVAGEFVDALGALARNIDAQLVHRGDGFGPDIVRLRTCAFYLEAVSGVVTQ
jgi:hypothetical protein